MKVLIINASHRQGNTDLAIKKIVQVLNSKTSEVRELKLRNIKIKMPDGCTSCAKGEYCPNIKDEFSQKVEPTIRNYDVYILATPVWSDNLTPLAKIFWDRVVSWCHPDTMYFKNKKLGIVAHGQASPKSWQTVVNWFKGVCKWEEAKYIGALTFRSGPESGKISLSNQKVEDFVSKITNNSKT